MNEDELKNWHRQQIKKLYPELREDQLEEAERNLRRYAEVLIRIADRLADEDEMRTEQNKNQPIENEPKNILPRSHGE